MSVYNGCGILALQLTSYESLHVYEWHNYQPPNGCLIFQEHLHRRALKIVKILDRYNTMESIKRPRRIFAILNFT